MESFNDIEIIYPNMGYEERKMKVTKYHIIGLPMLISSFFLFFFSVINSLKYYYQNSELFHYLFSGLAFISVICVAIAFVLGSFEIGENILLARKLDELRIFKLNIDKQKSIIEFILIDKNDEVSEHKVAFLELVYKFKMDKPLLNLEESKLYIPYKELAMK